MEDPVIYQALDAINQLNALAAEGRPNSIVEDIQTTGDSWLAMRQLLKQEGIEPQGVAILAANELRLASDKDIERIAQKYAELTGSTLDEARKVIKNSLLVENSEQSPRNSNTASQEKMPNRLPSDWRLLPKYMQERARLNEERCQKALKEHRRLRISAI